MLIYHDPDEWEPHSETHTCPYHKANPQDIACAGCTCSASFGQRRRDPAEVAKIKERKRIEHEAKILAEADAIRARRGVN